MKNKKKYNKNRNLVCVIVVIILLIIILIKLNSKKDNKNTFSSNSNEDIQQLENENIMDRLKNMEERDRMEFYFSTFLECVENDKYEKAYNMLYEEFRNNYFPTLKDFQEYISKTFTEMTSIEHKNIERNGNVYVLWIDVVDVINSNKEEKKEMNFVIKENDFNDFVLSFSVI